MTVPARVSDASETKGTAMVGKRRFDEDAVLDAAMRVFWQRGYGATSIEDLERATGLRRGSLYNAYGSKETLFLRVFDRYAEAREEALLAALDAEPFGAALDALFARVLEGLAACDRPPGCLIASTLAEVGEAGAVGSAVAARTRASEARLEARIERARAAGALERHADPAAFARFLLATLRMLAILRRAGRPSEELRSIADTARGAVPVVADGGGEGRRDGR